MTQSLASYFSHRAFVLKSLVLSLLVLGSFISEVGEVWAVTLSSNTSNAGFDVVTTVNLNKSTYLAGETMYVSGSAFLTVSCMNMGALPATVELSGGGQSKYVFNGNYTTDGVSYYGDTGTTYFSSTMQAPTTPGVYMMVVYACEGGMWCQNGNIWITVLPANYGQSCPSAANACGQVSWGTIQASGACSVSAAPANPWNLGQSCASVPNVCGQVNTGTIQCNGTCSVGTPANPASLGQSCNSAPNSCGQTNPGTIQCNSLCSATTPSESGCYSCMGVVPSNASVHGGDTTNLSANTPYTYSAGGTSTKCEYSCNSGYVWNGSSCDALDIFATNASPAADALQKKGTNITFTGNAVNSNIASVPEGGWAGVEVDWGSDGSYTYYPANNNTQLGAFTPGQSKAISYTETNAPVGTHLYRFNVDSTNSLTESNEANNRSSWTSFRVVSGDLTAGPTYIHGPGTTTLSWNTQGTTGLNCTVQGGANTWTGTNNAGVISNLLTADVTYILACDGVELDRVLVAVDLTPDLMVDKRIVEQSTSVELTWKLYTQTNCLLSGGGLNMNVSVDDSHTVTVDGRTTYTLTCPIGSDAVTVEVVPKGWES